MKANILLWRLTIGEGWTEKGSLVRRRKNCGKEFKMKRKTSQRKVEESGGGERITPVHGLASVNNFLNGSQFLNVISLKNDVRTI